MTAPTNKPAIKDSKILLFTTETCPNCKIATTWLSNANIAYEKIDAEENRELTQKFAVMQAPTLVVVNNEDYEVFDAAPNNVLYGIDGNLYFIDTQIRLKS